MQQETPLDLDDDEDFIFNGEDRLIPPPHSWFGKDDQDDQGVSQKSSEANILSGEVYPLQSSDSLKEMSTGHYTPVSILPRPELAQMSTVGAPRKAPSWKELSSQVLPSAAKELLSASMQRIVYTARLSYAKGRWKRNYSDLGNPSTGYYRQDLTLPPFSSLSWIDRQLVREWRTIGDTAEHDEDDFENARTLVPKVLERKKWQKTDICRACRKPFGPTLLRHHCRLCGNSFCHEHSRQTHQLHHLGYDPLVPERVCYECKHALLEQNLAERVAWRMARCRDYFEGDLSPYFETGVDTMEDVALRITHAAISMARSIPLGAQAHVAVETVDVLRKYGLKGIYGLILRKEFLAAADLLCRACDINQATFPLSVHELSAAIFYALAQHRAIRGINPEREHVIHTLRRSNKQPDVPGHNSNKMTHSRTSGSSLQACESLVDDTDQYDPRSHNLATLIELSEAANEVERESKVQQLIGFPFVGTPCSGYSNGIAFVPVCEHVPDDVLNSCLLYAPIALNFVYVERHVDMQLLAAQQGWRILYAHLEQEPGNDRPGSALFLHEENKIACFAVRGTATIHDVVTDIRQTPVPFPENESEKAIEGDDWTAVVRGYGLAVCGMSRAAVNLFREHIDVLTVLASRFYKIRIVGHSLGAGVATLLGTLVKRHFETDHKFSKDHLFHDNDLVRVYSFASPSCVDATLSDYMQSFVTTVVLHDDVVPRLTPTSIRGLVKHLLHIRETWVQIHLKDDLMALTERARAAWKPRWRNGFTLRHASGFCRKQFQYGTKTLLSGKSSSTKFGKTSSFTDMPESFFEAPVEHTSDIEMKSSDCLDEASSSTTLVVEFMGGIDRRTDGTIIDDDEFFDTDDSLLESDNCGVEQFLDTFESIGHGTKQKPIDSDETWTGSDEESEALETPSRSKPVISSCDLEDVDDQSAPVMLDETPLPRMFLPGRIMHIYTHRGAYKAAFVPRTFRELRRISMAGNMLSDHTSNAYFDALKEVKSVRAAQENLPQWTAYDEDDTCSCCASRFTWASTSDSEAQEARDKHNCRSCGTLCCDPCAKNRIPMPSIGIMVPVRVCDRCYHDIAGVASRERTLTPDGTHIHLDKDSQDFIVEHKVPERVRERRSVVVDDLASRIHSTVIVHN